jgi:hypothetical protein
MSAFVPVSFGIPESFARELAAVNDLLDLSALASQTGDLIFREMLTAGVDTEYKGVVAMMFAKALKTANSTQIVCRSGCGSDGLSLCAVLFENLVDLLYIGQSPRRRSRRYAQFENVEKLYHVQKILQAKRLPKGVRKVYRRYEKELLSMAGPLARYFPKKSKGWSQKSLFDRAKSIGAKRAYNELYWIFCAHKHTLPMSAIHTTTLHESGRSVPISVPHMQGVVDAMEQGAKHLLQIAIVATHVFRLSHEPALRALISSIETEVSTLRRNRPDLF